jgi:hypothetical protein
MEVSDWPMDPETWKEEHDKYVIEYRSYMNEKYNIQFGYVEFKAVVAAAEAEVAAAAAKAAAEEEKDILVSPALLEACEQFLLENEAIETLNKHKFGEKALENLYRPEGPMFKKGEESYYNTELQNVTKKKGGKRKKTKKKGGTKTIQEIESQKDTNNYILNSIISKAKKYPQKYARKLENRVERIKKDNTVVDQSVLEDANNFLKKVKDAEKKLAMSKASLNPERSKNPTYRNPMQFGDLDPEIRHMISQNVTKKKGGKRKKRKTKKKTKSKPKNKK